MNSASRATARNRVCLVLLAIAAVGCNSPPPPGDSKPVLPPTPAEFADGQALYEQGCASCHDTSKEGAPRLGFLRAWKRRIEKGEAALVKTAIEGVDLMPPRGDNPELSDDDITAIVRYMIYRAELDIPAKK